MTAMSEARFFYFFSVEHSPGLHVTVESNLNMDTWIPFVAGHLKRMLVAF